MTHKFNPEHKNKLDNEWRRQVIPPKSTLENLGLLSEDIVADVGCGIGYFTIPAAEIISSNCKVYALDTSKEMLTEVERRAEAAGISNINVLKTEEYDLKLPNQAVSFILMVTVIHEIADKEKFLREAQRILQSDGRLVVIDWEKKQTEAGPPVDHRLDKQEAKEILRACGFEIRRELEIGDIYYGLVAEQHSKQ